MSEKTEQPTTERLAKARREGDSGVSAFASQAVAFVAAVALMPAAVRALADRGRSLVTAAIAAVTERPRLASPSLDGAALAREVLSLTLPLLGAAALTAAVASSVQAGGAFATKKLAPDLSRLDPFSGLDRLFKLDRAFAALRSLVAAGFVAWLTWATLRGVALDLAHASAKIDAAVAVAARAAEILARDAAIVGVAVAVLDLVITRRSWRKRLMMSKDDIKKERKDSDGDPQVKAARERARHEVMTAVVVAKVKEASVVVVNPTHLACALRYDECESDAAPVVVASGRGELAARIVEAANAYGIPVLRDVPLARALIELEMDEAIPEALYEAVAEILRAAWEEE